MLNLINTWLFIAYVASLSLRSLSKVLSGFRPDLRKILLSIYKKLFWIYRAMIWDEFLRHFRFCDEEDSGLSDEEQERKGPKNRPKHTRKRIHQAKKNFLEKFKTASYMGAYRIRPNALPCLYRRWGEFQIATHLWRRLYFSFGKCFYIKSFLLPLHRYRRFIL